MITCGVLLAAGTGSRFAGHEHKLLAHLAGRPVWQHSLEHLVAADLDHTIVVTGAVPLEVPDGVTECYNPLYLSGQASSLQRALQQARHWNVDAIVVGLADQPFIEPSAWRAVADAPPTCRIAVANYAGTRGPNPVRLAAPIWHLLPTEGDEGARSVLRDHPELVCDIPCLGSVEDIDTTEDLQRWKNC